MTQISRKLIIVAVVLAAISTYLLYSYLTSIENEKENITKASVIVAVRDINPGEKIDSSMVKEEKIDSSFINVGAIQDTGKIMGKYVTDKIIAGEQILGKRVSSEGNQQLSFMIPVGKKAATITINEVIGIGYLIKPGDFIDVVAVLDAETENYGDIEQKFIKTAKSILQNIQVLSVGPIKYKEENEDGEVVNTYTLAVTTEEAEKLIYAEEFGSIRLILRQVEDHEMIETKGIRRIDITPTN